MHIVFSTKHLTPYLTNRELRTKTHAILSTIAKRLGCNPIQIGGPTDPVHLLTTLSRTLSIVDLVKELKSLSTNWIRNRESTLQAFRWQTSYGVFYVNPLNAARLIKYIQNQESHHKSNHDHNQNVESNEHNLRD
ncbi:MAG TPA: transposase [Candidatus Latescibacteria bacterium]|nr:transposase [Gemmatimonadota bacterium]HCR19110.1 transposase [Candidatus Latescibacterota bacterium]